MAGTKTGGAKAAATNKAKYGKDFYREMGKIGGKVGRTGGFYANRELAREAGRKGGLVSKRKNTVEAPDGKPTVVPSVQERPETEKVSWLKRLTNR